MRPAWRQFVSRGKAARTSANVPARVTSGRQSQAWITTTRPTLISPLLKALTSTLVWTSNRPRAGKCAALCAARLRIGGVFREFRWGVRLARGGTEHKCSLYRRKSQAAAIPGLLRWWSGPPAARCYPCVRMLSHFLRRRVGRCVGDSGRSFPPPRPRTACSKWSSVTCI